MASDRQIEANRRNSQNCTGPRTPEGKTISSQNALKTGLDAKSEVMRCEHRPDYETLVTEYYARFHPVNPEERCLVDALIKAEWLGRRYMTIDAALWERGFYETESTSLGRVFQRSQQAFDSVSRRINSAQRNFQQALKQLQDLQAKRGPEPDPVDTPTDNPIDAQPVPADPPDTKLVSFPTPPPMPLPPAAIPENDPQDEPEKENDPPIAA